jgi:hypothetical protein
MYLTHNPNLAFNCDLVLRPPPTPGVAPNFVTYLELFATTCALEAVIYWPAFAWLQPASKWSTRTKAILGVNLATHPAVVFLLPLLAARLEISYACYLASAEIFATVIEALLLRWVFRFSMQTAFIVSIVANLFSWWIGLSLGL